jgi:hypothetical protein
MRRFEVPLEHTDDYVCAGPSRQIEESQPSIGLLVSSSLSLPDSRKRADICLKEIIFMGGDELTSNFRGAFEMRSSCLLALRNRETVSEEV